MARIPPPVARIRHAVRQALPGGPVLVACSGGADSLALAAAALFVGAPGQVGLVTVDHGLQVGSAKRALDVATWARSAGFAPVSVATVSVAGLTGGPEAAARTARYAALSDLAGSDLAGETTVLLGHTRDDQAETVLLALARGSGPRGLAGMPRRRGVFLRPLLDVTRADTRAACAALGLEPWDDPHNADPAFARSRVREAALPALVEALGPAVVANLARSAGQIAADNEVLDGLAEAALASAASVPTAAMPAPTAPVLVGLDILHLSGMPSGLRTRVLHLWARRLGSPGSALSHRHIAALDALVTDWHGQGPVHLPGAIKITRSNQALVRVPA